MHTPANHPSPVSTTPGGTDLVLEGEEDMYMRTFVSFRKSGSEIPRGEIVTRLAAVAVGILRVNPDPSAYNRTT
jgi:hypothetical protein